VRAEPVAEPVRGRWSRIGAVALQVVVSAAILVLLIREARPHAVGEALGGVAWLWLLAALVVKVAALCLHELRTWWLLRRGHDCTLGAVMGIGFLSGLVNMLLPVRAGDLLAMMLLTREQRVPGPVAVAAVGLVALLEAAALGVFLLVFFSAGLVQWEQVLGEQAAQRAVSTVSLVTMGGVVLVIGLGALGRLLGGRREPEPRAGGVLDRLRPSIDLVLEHSAGNLGRAGALASNIGLAMLDVGLFLASYALLIHALGLPVASAWTAAGAVLALSAVASIVLPPSLGAGTAASAVIALGLFGVSEPAALAYAALVWLVGTLPSVVLGLPPMFGRVGELAGLIGGAVRRALEPSRPTG